MAYISFQPSDHFSATAYTGNASTQAITGVGFQPDYVWLKCYDTVTYNYNNDSVRGVNNQIYSNENSANATSSTVLTAFGADGFTLGANGDTNGSGLDCVSWNWKAGTTSGLSGGTITPSAYSINTTSGFSIIKYTGNLSSASIPHGLGAVPELIMVKELNNAANWMVYYQNGNAGNTKYLNLNTNVISTSGTDVWDSTTPTSSVFYVGADGNSNGSGDEYIAYCFTPIKGYSCLASWTGAGGTHPFMYCGFEPAFVMAKNMESAKSWLIYDNKRFGFNQNSNNLCADTTAANATGNACDFTSQGFKVRVTTSALNAAGAPTFFMAFAAKPFVSSNSIPNTAR